MLKSSTIETKPMGMVDLGARADQRATSATGWPMGHVGCPAYHGIAGTRVLNATFVRPEGLGGSPG